MNAALDRLSVLSGKLKCGQHFFRGRTVTFLFHCTKKKHVFYLYNTQRKRKNAHVDYTFKASSISLCAPAYTCRCGGEF